MIGYVERKSTYIGIDVPPSVVLPYRKKLAEFLGREYEVFESNKFERDNESWHITVSMYKDYRKLTREQKNIILRPYEYAITGIGVVESGESTAWFCTVSSPKLVDAMDSVGLPARDLHITLAFKNSDIHGVDKSEASRFTTLPYSL